MNSMTKTNKSESAARITRLLGGATGAVGIIALSASTSMDKTGAIAGIDFNLGHSALLMVSAVVFLYASMVRQDLLRIVLPVFGVGFSILGIWGIVSGGNIDPLGVFGNINTYGSIVHLVIGGIALVAFTSLVPSRDV